MLFFQHALRLSAPAQLSFSLTSKLLSEPSSAQACLCRIARTRRGNHTASTIEKVEEGPICETDLLSAQSPIEETLA